MVTRTGDKTPLAGASVYLNNTTMGTVTSAQGTFDLAVQPGNYELVVSYVGYKPVSVALDERSPHEHLRIALHPSDKMLGEVVVRATSHWDEYLLQFKQFFLGKDEHAKACTIENPKALSFHYDDTAHVLRAAAAEPLVIDNRALGYRLYFELTTFVHNPARTSYAGFTRFEEMKPANGGEQRKWKANRKQAYYGSVAHFMQALVKGRLKSNGFVVKRLVKVSDSVPGHRVLPTWKGDEFRSSDTVVTMLWNGQGYTASDTALTRFNLISATGSGGRIPENQYEWGRKMGFNVLYPTRLPEDSILHQAADGSGYELAFDNSLFITYTKKVIVNERWLPGITNQYAFETSIITMNIPRTTVDRRGNLADPHAFVSAGYWSTLRVADQLPVDYHPGD